MSRRRIRLLILTGLLSISGTLVLQLIWLQQAVDLGEREFNDRVVIALTEVVDQIQSMRGDSAVVEPVRQQASNAFVANLNDTLHPFLLEALLRESFERAALDAPFDYAIYDCFSDSIVYGGHVGGVESVEAMPPRFDRDGHYFGIRFPDRRADILMSLDRWLLASILQLLVLGTFVYAISIVLKQKRLSEVREDFINNMTHEFKTPIASIESGAQLLQREDIGGDADARARYLGLILSENGRMRRQVEKVMEMATVEQGNVRLSSDPMDLREWALRGVDSAMPTVQKLEGRITAHVPETSVDTGFTGDATHMDGVLSNLIDNAIRYRGDAPPDIEVELERSSNAGSAWTLTVADRGIGVPADHLERIFDRFHRVPTGDRHDVKGFGLGLHYVRSIVEGHGGRIRCTRRDGGGSLFTLTLPAQRS
ncbi:MAG: sensor histidine kinase [Flavobacteriales bacterium]